MTIIFFQAQILCLDISIVFTIITLFFVAGSVNCMVLILFLLYCIFVSSFHTLNVKFVILGI